MREGKPINQPLLGRTLFSPFANDSHEESLPWGIAGNHGGNDACVHCTISGLERNNGFTAISRRKALLEYIVLFNDIFCLCKEVGPQLEKHTTSQLVFANCLSVICFTCQEFMKDFRCRILQRFPRMDLCLSGFS